MSILLLTLLSLSLCFLGSAATCTVARSAIGPGVPLLVLGTWLLASLLATIALLCRREE